jgi:hypothetical protein
MLGRAEPPLPTEPIEGREGAGADAAPAPDASDSGSELGLLALALDGGWLVGAGLLTPLEGADAAPLASATCVVCLLPQPSHVVLIKATPSQRYRCFMDDPSHEK